MGLRFALLRSTLDSPNKAFGFLNPHCWGRGVCLWMATDGRKLLPPDQNPTIVSSRLWWRGNGSRGKLGATADHHRANGYVVSIFAGAGVSAWIDTGSCALHFLGDVGSGFPARDPGRRTGCLGSAARRLRRGAGFQSTRCPTSEGIFSQQSAVDCRHGRCAGRRCAAL